MIKPSREEQILSILRERSRASVSELRDRIGTVSAVTIRRDLVRLAERGDLVRLHGGASARLAGPAAEDAGHAANDETIESFEDVEAIVLPPVEGRGADTLRALARRRGIPFLAESSPQEGGSYLGPDNFGAGRAIGLEAGERLAGRIEFASILLVSLEDLPNTRARCDGFLHGFGEAFGREPRICRVNGQGSFRVSLQASLDAFRTLPDINVVFGVNDHAILAAIEASDRLGIADVFGFSVGAEGGTLLDALAQRGKLLGCAALFPEIVGMRAVDVLADALAGASMPPEVPTPHAVLTADTLGSHYQKGPEGWRLASGAPALFGLPATAPRRGRLAGRVIGFVPHYPAHDWYRNIARAMQARAAEIGLVVRVMAPKAGIAREIAAVRDRVARIAASRIQPGETVLVNAGAFAPALCDALADTRDVTVVTNAFSVLERLSGRPGLKVILTSGEFQENERCLVGPSLGALFETLRVDRAFLSVDGISARFGASAGNERLALAARRFAEASREVIVLADHSLMGVEANHRIVSPRAVTEIVTDAGSLPADRLALASAGVRVTVADDPDSALPLPPSVRRPAEDPPSKGRTATNPPGRRTPR